VVPRKGQTKARYLRMLSAFFWTYSIFQILAGRLVDRYGVKWLYAWGILIWSLATAATGVIHSFSSLFVMRLALGTGESAAFPSVSYVICAASQRTTWASRIRW